VEGVRILCLIVLALSLGLTVLLPYAGGSL
jgi:hypothetical protein